MSTVCFNLEAPPLKYHLIPKGHKNSPSYCFFTFLRFNLKRKIFISCNTLKWGRIRRKNSLTAIFSAVCKPEWNSRIFSLQENLHFSHFFPAFRPGREKIQINHWAKLIFIEHFLQEKLLGKMTHSYKKKFLSFLAVIFMQNLTKNDGFYDFASRLLSVFKNFWARRRQRS